MLGCPFWSCGFGKTEKQQLFPFVIFPSTFLVSLTHSPKWTHIHAGSKSALARHFSREFRNLAACFPWKGLMEKAVVLWTCDRRVWFYTSRQAKHVPLCTTFVLPSRLWMAFQYGRQGQKEETHTGPNLNYKATLQSAHLTVLLPFSFFPNAIWSGLQLSDSSTSAFLATSAFQLIQKHLNATGKRGLS